jgi:hypothetical protein
MPADTSRGTLRSFVHAMLATMIMYYPECVTAQEMRINTLRLETTVAQLGLASTETASTVLGKWATLIRAGFSTDNLHLIERRDGGEMQQVTAAMRLMSENFTSQHKILYDLLVTSRRETAEVKDALSKLMGFITATAQSQAAGSSRMPSASETAPVHALAMLTLSKTLAAAKARCIELEKALEVAGVPVPPAREEEESVSLAAAATSSFSSSSSSAVAAAFASAAAGAAAAAAAGAAAAAAAAAGDAAAGDAVWFGSACELTKMEGELPIMGGSCRWLTVVERMRRWSATWHPERAQPTDET